MILPTSFLPTEPENEELQPKEKKLMREFKKHPQTFPATLSGETYLRVCELDLENPDEILEFILNNGPLGGSLAYTDLTTANERGEIDESWSGALDPDVERRVKEAALDSEDFELPVYRILSVAPDRSIVSPNAMSATDQGVPLIDFQPPLVETLNEFRFAAHCIRDLTTAWDVVRGGSEEPWTLESVIKPYSQPWTPMMAGNYLTNMLSRFLRRLSPQLDFSVAQVGEVDPDGLFDAMKHVDRGGSLPLSVEPHREPSDLPLYVLCALELYNHILEGATYHVCANERCRRRFVHQEGRSEKGQRRSRGVRFCTPACARATAQRDYRRRRLARERGES